MQRFCKPQFDSEPTRFLYVSGVGDALNSDPSTIINIFSQFGELDDPPVEMVPKKRYCFVLFKRTQSSHAAMNFLGNQVNNIQGIKFCIKYAQEQVIQGIIEPEDCVLAVDCNLPGFSLIEDFISESEELAVLNGLCSENNPVWEDSLNRRVQHYGFAFNYRTLLLDYTADTPPIPIDLTPIKERIQERVNSIDNDNTCENNENKKNGTSRSRNYHPLSQLTINEYYPGQGIAAHTDTIACFGPIICVLSLGSPIAMSFVLRSSQVSSSGSSQCPDNVSVWLTRRSLMILSGPARYAYTHCIASRHTDKVAGITIERTRRISLTFRQIVIPGGIPGKNLSAGELERSHVHEVYDSIAEHWHHTRGKRKVHWHSVREFLEQLPSGTLLADIGCGDGKYFGVNPDLIIIGCDRSFPLLQASHEEVISHQTDTFCCDAVTLPLMSDSFDAVMCIAVLHHISSVDRRVAIIRELIRIAKPGGNILIQAWAREQDGSVDKRHFDFASVDEQDVLVPWTLPARFIGNFPCSSSSSGLETDRSVPTLATVNRVFTEVEVSDERRRDREKADRTRRRAERKRAKARLKRQQSSSMPPGDADDDATKTSFVPPGNADDKVLHRYCHVYRKGELEDLCSGLISSGYDKGNWFVLLKRIDDPRLSNAYVAAPAPVPVINLRTLLNKI